MAAAAPPEGALDRALDHLLGSAPMLALGDLLPLIEQRREPAALVVAGQALAQCARTGQPALVDAAEKVLRAAAQAATRARSFGLAVTACRGIEELGHPATVEYDEIVQVFSCAPDLTPRAAPPGFEEKLPPQTDLDFLELVDRIEAICEQVAQGEISRAAPGTTELLCSKLGPEDLNVFARALEPRVIGAGEMIIREGQPGRAAYFLARGELEVVRGATTGTSAAPDGGVGALVLARLGSGSLFGEMALLSRSPRAASVLAVRPSIVLRGSRQALQALAEKNPRLGTALAAFCRRRMIDNLVRTSPVLKALHAAERQELLARFQTQTFETGEVVTREGQEGCGLHLVASGALRVVAGQGQDETHLTTLRTGDVVGEVELVLRRPSSTAVVAECPSVTLHLPAQEFLAVVREHPELLAELYERAVEREEETRNLLAHEAQDASDFVLF